MAKSRLIGSYPVIGIRPTIDGRRGALDVRGSLEEQTMNMAKSAAKLLEENLRYSNGEPVKVVIADTTIGRVGETAACADKFRREGVDITLTVTPCWCYGSETMDMDPQTIKAVWGFNATERPGAVYLASVLATHAQKGLPAFGIYGHEVQDADDTTIPEDVKEKILRFGRAAVAAASMREGFKTAILDGDITGPSIPKAFGLSMNLVGNAEGLILPATTTCGIDIVSVNLMLANETDPVIWRGPVLGGVIKQFWGETLWQNIDYMFIDMPPGTGDVPLTIFQSVPLDGIVIVSSPQELVGMIVEKAVNMARMMNVPILGLVENMSYVECPDCGKQIKVFGESHIDEIAAEYDVPVLAKLPMDPALAAACDAGKIEYVENNYMKDAIEVLKKL